MHKDVRGPNLPTLISIPPQSRTQVRSICGPLVAMTALAIETQIMKSVREKIPASASFFCMLICRFHKMLVDTRTTTGG